MEYTEAMLWCLRMMPDEQLDELKQEWERKYAGSEVLRFLMWLLARKSDTSSDTSR